MSALTEKHAQLVKSNRALLLTFETLPVTVKLSVTAIALTLGVISGIQAFKGNASDMAQVCIRNKQLLQCVDRTRKPYLMTDYHAQQWKADGVPSEVAFLKPKPATNPRKALWMLLSACGFGGASVMLRSLQDSERQLAGYEAIAEKRDLAKGEINARRELLEDYRSVAIEEVRLQADLEATANNLAVALKQCEVLGEADVKIAQLEAEEAIFEAETAGLSEDKKQEYMEFLRNQKTPFLLTGTQTIDSIAYPGDKVEALDDSDCLPRASMPDLSNYPAVLYYGPQGSGKTFAAEQEVVKRRETGHRIIAIDPHAGFDSWKGAEVVGAGMDYEAIDAQLAWLAAEIKKRYKQIRNEPNPQFQPLTIVCDEFTNWGSRCKSSADFFQAALSDVRKAQCFILLISHARTLAGLGKAAGFADSRDAGLLEIEFLVNLDANGKASPRYKALIKLPGTALSDRFAISIAKIEPNLSNSEPSDKAYTDCSGNSRNLPNSKPENPGNPYGIRAEAVEACVSNALKGPGKCPIFSNSELSDEQKKEAAKIIILQNLGVENTILILWGLKSGGRNHRLYVEAREMLDRLIKEIQE